MTAGHRATLAFRAPAGTLARLRSLAVWRQRTAKGVFAAIAGERLTVAGPPEAVVAFALGARRRLPLTLDRSGRPEIHGGMSVPAALGAIVLECLALWMENQPAGPVSERNIHQMRVALRRLRAGIGLLKADAGEEGLALRDRVKAFAGALGHARDWDVFLGETLPMVIEAVPDRAPLERLRAPAEQGRRQEYDRVEAQIAGEEGAALLLDLAAWADMLAGRQDGPTLAEAAPHFIDKRFSKMRKRGRHFEELAPAPRHELRIEIKKLRYAIDFLSCCLPDRKTRRFSKQLSVLQDALGQLNDAAVAGTLLDALDKRNSYAAGLLIGWLTAHGGARTEELTELWRALMEVEPFWRD